MGPLVDMPYIRGPPFPWPTSEIATYFEVQVVSRGYDLLAVDSECAGGMAYPYDQPYDGTTGD